MNTPSNPTCTVFNSQIASILNPQDLYSDRGHYSITSDKAYYQNLHIEWTIGMGLNTLAGNPLMPTNVNENIKLKLDLKANTVFSDETITQYSLTNTKSRYTNNTRTFLHYTYQQIFPDFPNLFTRKDTIQTNLIFPSLPPTDDIYAVDKNVHQYLTNVKNYYIYLDQIVNLNTTNYFILPVVAPIDSTSYTYNLSLKNTKFTIYVSSCNNYKSEQLPPPNNEKNTIHMIYPPESETPPDPSLPPVEPIRMPAFAAPTTGYIIPISLDNGATWLNPTSSFVIDSYKITYVGGYYDNLSKPTEMGNIWLSQNYVSNFGPMVFKIEPLPLPSNQIESNMPYIIGGIILIAILYYISRYKK